MTLSDDSGMAPAPRSLRYAAALEEAMVEEMRRDSRIICLGTQLPERLIREFGPDRVRRTPISEAAMTGIAIGAALSGQRPVVYWRNVTFSFSAFDQVVNQAAKLRYMSGGQATLPIVLRAYCGAGNRIAAQHSHSPYAMFAQVPGLKVIVPANAGDAHGLLKAAIRDDAPVVCLEPSRLDNIEGELPAGDYVCPIGQALLVREGTDVTLVAIGYMVELAKEAASELASSISVEIIDPRSIVPLDTETICSSVRKTGRLVVVDEAPSTCSMASEITAVVASTAETFSRLRAPIARVTGRAVPIPYSPPLEDYVIPSKESIVDALHGVMSGSPRG